MTADRFWTAVSEAVLCRDSIGTYAEKSVHAVLKRYYEPDGGRTERRIGPYTADIVSEDGIIEVQTGSFHKLRAKLDLFLSVARVTLVYPFPAERRLVRVDGVTGEVLGRRKAPSPRLADACRELSAVRAQLARPGMRLIVALLHVEEYRVVGAGRGKRRGDNVPVALLGELFFECPADYLRFLPNGLSERFTVTEFRQVAGCRVESARSALSLLSGVGAVSCVGKRGRAFVYERQEDVKA